MDVRIRMNSAGNARGGWLASFGLVESECEFETEGHVAKVQRTAMIWPATIYAQLVSSVLILVAVVATGSIDRLLPVGALILAMLGISAGAMAAFRGKRFWQLSPERQIRYSLPVAAALGTVQAALGWQASLLPHHSMMTLSMSATIATAAITLVALMSMHITIMVFAATATLVTVVAVGSLAMANTGIALLACLWVTSVAHARFDSYLSRQRQQSEDKSRRASRLLAEFEANGSGWFWETDRSGHLVYLSDKLATGLGKTTEELLGQPLTSLIRPEGGAQDGERTLGFHLSTRSAFTDVSVRAALEDEERWWSLSGRPIIDEIGQFRGYAGSGADLTEKRRSQAEANRLARYDELTGLANRQQMRLALEEALGEDDAPAKPVALFLLDLDRFKTINDTMGHPVGDALLKQVAQRLFRAVGERGLVGRLGGDEFKVVLPEMVHRKELSELARNVISSLSHPYMIDGVTLSIGCSIGVAIAPDHGTTSEELIRNADLALYAAKADGRGVHRFYEREMHTGAKRRKRLEDDLRNALNNGELHLTYQPIVSTADVSIVGYEALIRWEHPSHGAISPADFIPVAEDIRLIEYIGDWVLRTACQDAAKWPGQVRVAVNVSPIQFASPNFPQFVMRALSASGLAPSRLELEVTETVFLDESADIDHVFRTLKNLGVRLALDDFGTGYSSLGYLKTAPFDKIKIDQSFIRGAAVPGNRNAAIIKSIVALANTLYMETTAEGVELEDEVALIRELGCSHIQGYIYGKPMCAEDVLAQLSHADGKAAASGFRASRSPRTSMLKSSSVEVGGRTQKVLIRNLSATGAMIEGLSGAKVDADVLIELLENEMFPAKIRWSENDRVGIEFARNFDLERFNAMPVKPHVKQAANG